MSLPVKLNYMIFSEEAILSVNNNISLINIFDNINANGLPASQLKLCVTINLELLDENSHTIKIKINDMNSNTIAEGADFSVKKSDNKDRVQMVNTFINTVFKEAGDYLVYCLFDNTILAEKKLSVVKI